MNHTNCPNCAAPLKGGRCEYCGTELPGTVSSKMEINATGIRLECSRIGFVPVDDWKKSGIPLISMYSGSIIS